MSIYFYLFLSFLSFFCRFYLFSIFSILFLSFLYFFIAFLEFLAVLSEQMLVVNRIAVWISSQLASAESVGRVGGLPLITIWDVSGHLLSKHLSV